MLNQNNQSMEERALRLAAEAEKMYTLLVNLRADLVFGEGNEGYISEIDTIIDKVEGVNDGK